MYLLEKRIIKDAQRNFCLCYAPRQRIRYRPDWLTISILPTPFIAVTVRGPDTFQSQHDINWVSDVNSGSAGRRCIAIASSSLYKLAALAVRFPPIPPMS